MSDITSPVYQRLANVLNMKDLSDIAVWFGVSLERIKSWHGQNVLPLKYQLLCEHRGIRRQYLRTGAQPAFKNQDNVVETQKSVLRKPEVDYYKVFEGLGASDTADMLMNVHIALLKKIGEDHPAWARNMTIDELRDLSKEYLHHCIDQV